MIYCDTPALVKLVVSEVESVAMTQFVRSHERLASSELAITELFRAVPQAAPAVDQLLDGLSLIPITRSLLVAAGRLPGTLRSLDAIHVATALSIRATVLVTYDTRMYNASNIVGITPKAPKASSTSPSSNPV